MSGWIEVITSPSMFAGKTRRFLQHLNQQKYGNRNVFIYKPVRDNKDNLIDKEIRTHDGEVKYCKGIKYAEDIITDIRQGIEYGDNRKVVIGIDEVQFFTKGIVQTIEFLRDINVYLILAGLSSTAEGKPFGYMGDIMCIADDIIHIKGICECGNIATKTQYYGKKDKDIEIGGKDKYSPRCNNCWEGGSYNE